MYSSLVVGLAMIVGAPGEKEKKDSASIVGEWKAEKGVRGGQEMPLPEGGIKVTFTADGKVKIVEGITEKDEQGTYKFDTKKNPMEIDVTPPKEEGMHLGIFKIDGDTLTLCLGEPKGKDRPTKFESPDGSMVMLLTLKRTTK